MKPVVAQLRKQGICLIIYLDNILIIAEAETLANQHAQTACNLLEALGFVINYQKSNLIPSKKMEFLGLLVDSQALTLALPCDKI
jgi:RecG-like helicase